MRFRQQQERSRAATRWLVLLFALTVLLTVAAVNAALALAWKLQFGLSAYPPWFFETNTAVVLGFVLGGWWLQWLQLREGGARVAALIGGRELEAPATIAERRLLNIVDELAIASGLPPPRVFVLDGEAAINAFAAGWGSADSIVAVSRGALERLARDELAGVVAHELAHIAAGDTRLNMRLIGMVSGLQLVSDFGRGLMQPLDDRGRRGPTWLIGAALAGAGAIGWFAARLLKAGVSREREFLADAAAVQFTREPSGLGNALRKIATQERRGERLRHLNADLLAPLLLASDAGGSSRWLATHPPLAERVRRLFGHEMPPLPDDPIEVVEDEPAPALAAVPFTTVAIASAADSARAAPPAAEDVSALGELPVEDIEAALLAFFEAGNGVAAVRSLGEAARLPWFERLAADASGLPHERRLDLLRRARALVQADGRVSLGEVLMIRALQRLLGLQAPVAPAAQQLALADLAEAIGDVTFDLATSLPTERQRPWADAVLRQLALSPRCADAQAAAHLNRAFDRLELLARPQRPALAKAWVAAAAADLPRACADALRCACVLLDTPLPPALAACFEEPPVRESQGA